MDTKLVTLTGKGDPLPKWAKRLSFKAPFWSRETPMVGRIQLTFDETCVAFGCVCRGRKAVRDAIFRMAKMRTLPQRRSLARAEARYLERQLRMRDKDHTASKLP